ncbi:MAG: hypothetical protein ACREDI_10900 [Roseiarcus sp.]
MKSEIEQHAAFYRGYLIDDRSLTPLTVAWTTIVVLWLLVYLVSCVGSLAAKPPTAESAAQWSTLAARSMNP